MFEKKVVASSISNHWLAIILTLGFPIWGLVLESYSFDSRFGVFLLLPLGFLNYPIRPSDFAFSTLILASVGLLVGLIAEILWKLEKWGRLIILVAILLNTCGFIY